MILIVSCFFSCKNTIENEKEKYLTESIPTNIPITFKENLTPKDKLIHKGIFSPDFKQYYYTISDTAYKQFNVYVIQKQNGSWSEPRKAFFNSTYSEHGMSFSPDGNSIYFSSTRPTNIEGVSETWHIWKSDKIDGNWQEPAYVDIPNLRDKLVSHPILTNSKTLYFHASNLDYSDMDIYHSKSVNDTFEDAEKISISTATNIGKCTPYVSANEEYLIFASIGNQLDLMIAFNDGSGKWIHTKRLNDTINQSSQGNPYVTPDNKFLFYTTGGHQNESWNVKWVHIESEIKNN
jgi:hypothetical protein